MKHSQSIPLAGLVFLSLAALFASQAHAQAQVPDRMYRCDDNYYTNSLTDPKARGCKPLETGNVTVVQGTKPATVQNGVKLAVATPSSSSSGGTPGQRVDANDQRARDADAKGIMETELRRAEARKTELALEYNNGEPEKRGDEVRNYQKYLDRVAELKANLARVESDIAGIRRELGRGAASSAVGGSGASTLR
jgi:hypothetical protein